MWDEIMYPFPNFNCPTIEVWEWINNFILHLVEHVITYPCSNLSLKKHPEGRTSITLVIQVNTNIFPR